jgi:hypothetical protein
VRQDGVAESRVPGAEVLDARHVGEVGNRRRRRGARLARQVIGARLEAEADQERLALARRRVAGREHLRLGLAGLEHAHARGAELRRA